jgi:hypothetical protein
MHRVTKSQTMYQNQKNKHDKELNSYHLISSSNENGHSSGVLTLLDDQHFVFSCAK